MEICLVGAYSQETKYLFFKEQYIYLLNSTYWGIILAPLPTVGNTENDIN